ncbi:nucleotidyltransferase family protein [Flexivirga meconopsidis]|uniref:nucleotidyltransferase family protein n=1 Tax=Flexivirga meconopsidis TaxID=2977121 RepID=UPI0022403C26|nr:nucleotidyltransferase family protein [Flexivirga meconopsidis]
MTVAALILAAGAGRRMGAPKALIRDADGRSWVERAVQVAADAGCRSVVVVSGAAGDQVEALLDEAVLKQAGACVIRNEQWAAGMGGSLRAGLSVLHERPGVTAALVCLVDLPDVGADVLRRVALGARRDTLSRATYGGSPGHPVLLGADHFARLLASDSTDGAGGYLREHGARAVECGDLATGRDADTVARLPTGHRLPRG